MLIELRDLPILLNFLISFFLYSVGVQSVILLATVYGSTELGLPTSNLIIAIIVIQLLGILGAYLFSKLSERIGNITTLKITIIIWAFASLSGYFLERDDPNVQLKFYFISAFIGLVLGAIQTLSRSTYSKLLPEDTQDHTTYFSFYDVLEKLGIVIGTFFFGFIEGIFSIRESVLMC